jgi:8-amino-7-oxononanoate synthase
MSLRLSGAHLQHSNSVHALRGVDLTIARGERVAIIGPSGAGKSSLLNLLATALPPSAGQVEVLGRAPWRLSARQRQHLRQIIIVTESIFSMDGDQADLPALAELKRRYGNVLLYVDEAHAFGVRGRQGLGCAEESGCTGDIDFLVGTFGKAAASAGAYIVCRKVIREYLVNRMRTLIFTTGLPPVNIAWTLFVVRRLADMRERREHLAHISRTLREALQAQGYTCPGASHIVPMIIGQSADAVLKAEALQRHGFYALPVRPPTVPEGTSRIRFSLTADIRQEEIEELKKRTENLK